MTDDLPKGYTCKCGAEHKFSAYVFAHRGRRKMDDSGSRPGQGQLAATIFQSAR